MSFTVKRVADLAGVSVRTLHHYDHIGLLRPATVTEAGYRIYSEADLERLQQILFFRELGFELRQIKEILDRPDFDHRHALQAHRELLIEKRDRIAELIDTIDASLERIERNKTMSDKEMFRGFEDRREEQIARYRDEANERYGKETVEESEQRVRSMSADEWQSVEAEMVDINQRLANLMDDHTPASDEVQEQVERWYNLLNANFSTYTPEIFANLGDLYVEDARFTQTYDSVRPGLAAFLRDGMREFANRRSE